MKNDKSNLSNNLSIGKGWKRYQCHISVGDQCYSIYFWDRCSKFTIQGQDISGYTFQSITVRWIRLKTLSRSAIAWLFFLSSCFANLVLFMLMPHVLWWSTIQNNRNRCIAVNAKNTQYFEPHWRPLAEEQCHDSFSFAWLTCFHSIP